MEKRLTTSVYFALRLPPDFVDAPFARFVVDLVIFLGVFAAMPRSYQ